jgi:hypothetical protein
MPSLIAAFRELGPRSYEPAAQSMFDYPDPLWGAEGIDLILMGQKIRARFPQPRHSRAVWNR